MIWFKPFPDDWNDWVDDGLRRLVERRDGPVLRAASPARTGSSARPTATRSCSTGSTPAARRSASRRTPTGTPAPVPRRRRLPRRRLRPRTPASARRRRVMYLHPVMGARRTCRSRPSRARCGSSVQDGRAVGRRGAARLRRPRPDRGPQGDHRRRAGSVDTPRLLLYSGIGPRKDLERLGIDVVHDLPGVGENLIDHPESIIIWKLRRPMGPEGAMDADCALFVNRLGADDRPDLMYHTYQLPFTFNTERLGYEVPDDRWCICMTPNIPRSHSDGPAVPAVEEPGHQAGARLPLLHGRRRLRRADDRRRAEAGPRGGRDGAVRRLDRARDRARARPSRATPTCRRTGAPCTTPSTTRPARARWAPPTTSWPWSTPT